MLQVLYLLLSLTVPSYASPPNLYRRNILIRKHLDPRTGDAYLQHTMTYTIVIGIFSFCILRHRGSILLSFSFDAPTCMARSKERSCTSETRLPVALSTMLCSDQHPPAVQFIILLALWSRVPSVERIHIIDAAVAGTQQDQG